jgi:hypothetical protein
MLLRIYGKHFTAVPRIDGSLSSRRLASHHPAMASQSDRAECPIGVIRVISSVRWPLPVYTQHQTYRYVASNGVPGQQ